MLHHFQVLHFSSLTQNLDDRKYKMKKTNAIHFISITKNKNCILDIKIISKNNGEMLHHFEILHFFLESENERRPKIQNNIKTNAINLISITQITIVFYAPKT